MRYMTFSSRRFEAMTYSYPQVREAGVLELHRELLRVFCSGVTTTKMVSFPSYFYIDEDFLSGLEYLVAEYDFHFLYS